MFQALHILGVSTLKDTLFESNRFSQVESFDQKIDFSKNVEKYYFAFYATSE